MAGDEGFDTGGQLKLHWSFSSFFILIPLIASNKAKDPPYGEPLALAGTEGFEPPNAGTKTRCLTTWRRPTGATEAVWRRNPAQTATSTFFTHPMSRGSASNRYDFTVFLCFIQQ